jgi:hypothetical protein
MRPSEEQERVEELKKQITDAAKELRLNGLSVVACIADYDRKHLSANFTTVLNLCAFYQHAAGITGQSPANYTSDDHIVLDALREITGEWSKISHTK